MQHPTLTVQTVSMAARANLFCDLTPSLYTTNNIASKKNHLWCFFLCTYGATPQPWWWWLVKIWKSDPLQQAIKKISKQQLPYYPTLTIQTVLNQWLLSLNKKKQKKSCQNPSRIQKRTKQDFDRSSKKKNSIYKWAASFYLMNISMPNNDRTGGTLFWIIHQKRCHTDITCSQKPKNNSFLFLKKTTILLQWIRSIFKIVCDCVWLYTYLLTYYLKVLTYFWFLFSFFVFSLFLFSFFL